MKKLFFIAFAAGLFFGFSNLASAHDGVDIDFFYSPTCPYCAKEKAFLQTMEDEYEGIKINQYDVINSQSSQKLLREFYQRYGVPKSLQGLVPATFTPARYFIGFDDKVAKELDSCLKECMASDSNELSLSHASIIEKTIKIPFFGEIKTGNLSFPVMAVALGALDGFNVCSLGALILILSLVLTFHSRKKILIFGGTYLLSTAIVYGFLIFFWYKLFEAVAPYLKIMNILIGGLGLAGGIYFLRQFLKSRKKCLTCESDSGSKLSSRFLPKLENLFKRPASIFLAIGAVFAFALILTVVEFPCSAVVPIAFAAVMAQAGLPAFSYIFYIAIYTLFYLLDELIVFLIAIFTSKIWLSSPKFFKWIVLLEAIILFSLGFYYLSSLI